MRDNRDDYSESDFPYARPSVSAWVAAAAVALAFFVVGGFIKNYHQLESLREESRREIRELRSQLEALRNSAAATAAGQGAAAHREPVVKVPALPPSRQRPAREAAPPSVPAPPRPRIPEIDDTDAGITFTIGRKTNSPAPAAFDGLGSGRSQVVAVNTGQKRIMVEGGNDLGLGIGARLELSRQGRWIGDLRVVEVFDTMSSCEVLHATLTPQPGDTVRTP